MIKLLLTSVGSLVGQNLLDVIDVRGDDICVVGTTSLAVIPLRRCERVYLVPLTERPPSGFCSRLLEIIDRERPDLIVPTRDLDVMVMADLAAAYPHLAGRTPCGTPDTAALIEDKWLSYVFAREHGLAFAESAVPDAKSRHEAVRQLAKKVGFPLVAKPRAGFGSRQVLLLDNSDQLNAALASEELVVQRYIGGPRVLRTFQSNVSRWGHPLFYSLEQDKYSVQTYVYRDGTVGSVCCTLHRMEKGLSVAVERVADERLTAIGQGWGKTLGEAGWRGPLNIQCQMDADSSFVAFELNGRFTGATAARYCLGHDEMGCLFEDRLGQVPHRERAAADLVPVKFHRTLGVSRAYVEVLSRGHVWDRQESAHSQDTPGKP